MKTFNYEVVTTTGQASGSLIAESEAEANEMLTKQYTGVMSSVDEDRNPIDIKIEIVSIDLNEASNG